MKLKVMRLCWTYILRTDYKADLSDWWNGAGELSFVQVLANDDFFGSVFFATDNGELWIYCDGVFFRAEKAA